MNMKATGIVRRIDDLGRVVIPKEIRRTLRIREGDPLEIFVARDGEVILKKYSPINELGHFATEYADALFDTVQQPILISDRDEMIALAGLSKSEYLNKSIGLPIEEIIEDRKLVFESDVETLEVIRGKEESLNSYCVSPIIANGDPIGSVIVFSRSDESLGEAEQKVVETAARFLAKQME